MENKNKILSFVETSKDGTIIFQNGIQNREIFLKKYYYETTPQFELLDYSEHFLYSKKYETFEAMLNDLERILSLKKTIEGGTCIIDNKSKKNMEERFKYVDKTFELKKNFTKEYNKSLTNKFYFETFYLTSPIIPQNKDEKLCFEKIMEVFHSPQCKILIKEYVIQHFDFDNGTLETFFNDDWLLWLYDNIEFEKKLEAMIIEKIKEVPLKTTYKNTNKKNLNKRNIQ